MFGFRSFDSYSQHFEKENIIGDFQNLNDTNEFHLITNNSWIVKTPTKVMRFDWNYLFTIQKQLNNQPKLFHEELELKNSSDSILFDIVNYWSDTLLFYNKTTQKPLKLILVN